jgi:glutaredoxin
MGACAVALAAVVARADTVTLKSGEKVVGLVLQDTPKVVSVKRRGEILLFKPSEVVSVELNKNGTDGAEHLGHGRAVATVAPKEAPVETAAPITGSIHSGGSKAGGHDVRDAQVVIYGTSWCGFCKRARAWFTERNIPFTDLDVERDHDARAEVSRKCREQGSSFNGGVPVLDVNGKIIDGFDIPAIKIALGEKD